MSTLALRVAVTAANALLLVAIAHLAWPAALEVPAVPEAAPALRTPRAWAPPAWHPNATGDLWVLPEVDGPDTEARRPPRIGARAAIVVDLDRGEALWSRGADDIWPIASLTKVVSSLTLASTDPDLDRTLCVDIEHWPSRPGARSRLETGTCHTGWEYVGAALVASDNRAAMAFPSLADMEYFAFVDRMEDVAASLGLRGASFTDPAGIEDDNMASARDVAKAIVALAAHPTLATVASSAHWDIDRERGQRRLPSTNRLLRSERVHTVAAKTGYTSTAGWCFAGVMEAAAGGRYAVVVLGARSVQARFDDALRLVDWASDSHA